MATTIPPIVRSMILCDEVKHDPNRPGRLTIEGFLPQLRWPEGRTTPLPLEKLLVFLILTDGRGEGQGRITCSNEETGFPIFETGAALISFLGKDPTQPMGRLIVARDCRFPAPGSYLFRFLFEGKVLSQQSLIVR
jgi:hypothetical protein